MPPIKRPSSHRVNDDKPCFFWCALLTKARGSCSSMGMNRDRCQVGDFELILDESVRSLGQDQVEEAPSISNPNSQHNQLADDTQNDSRFFFKNVSRSLAAHLVSTSSRDCRLLQVVLHQFDPCIPSSQGHPDAQVDIYPRMCASGLGTGLSSLGTLGKPLLLP